MQKIITAINGFLGIGGNKTSHREKLISGLGGFIGILVILLVTRQFVGAGDVELIVASMGASAVLVFAVPHGPLSQPWALIGGHLISAFIGVSCQLFIPDIFVAAATAVGLAISAMYYLRCIHPPGGATALTAVIASSVHPLGYTFLLTPVLINVVIIFLMAIGFNFLFQWRRYPAVIMQYRRTPPEKSRPVVETLSREDLEHALQQMNLYVDISHDDLERIYQLAKNRSQTQMPVDHVRLGHYYSNGEYGSNWSVRQVVDEADKPRPGRDLIIYKVVAGNGRRSSGMVTRDEFAQWARYEVYLNENSWQRVAPLHEAAGIV